jgi:hypothetical protein
MVKEFRVLGLSVWASGFKDSRGKDLGYMVQGKGWRM